MCASVRSSPSVSPSSSPWIRYIFITLTLYINLYIYNPFANASGPAADIFVPLVTTNTELNRSTTFAIHAPPISEHRRLRRDEESSLSSLRTSQDICESKLCNCVEVSSVFLTINCDFNLNKKLPRIFGKYLNLPNRAVSLNIILASHTNFRIEKGFFKNNAINSLHIKGNTQHAEQVEIVTDAFKDNHGPYPSIEIIGCYSVNIRANAFLGDLQLNIRQSNNVNIFSSAFSNTHVRAEFSDITDLRIQEKAFNSAYAKIKILNSHMDDLYRLDASIREIYFKNCSIGTVNSGTFDVINIDSIQFEDCSIGTIEARTFTDRIYSKHVAFIGTKIKNIKSQAFSGSGIDELILIRNTIDEIQPKAITVIAVNISIHENNITHALNDWVRISSWTNISINKNKFGNFGHMRLNETEFSNIKSCKFYANSITKPQSGSLDLPYPYCQIHEVLINHSCSCLTSWLEQLTPRDLRSESYCLIDEQLEHCLGTKNFNVLKYIHEICDEDKTEIDCLKNRKLEKKNGIFYDPEELNRYENENRYIYYVVLAVAITILIICGLLLIYCIRNKKKNMSNSQTNDPIYAEVPEKVGTVCPVYEEPANVRQQLLPNSTPQEPSEYSTPKDGCTNKEVVYSEPFIAIATPITDLNQCQQRPPLFSRTANLSNVLGHQSWSTNPQPNVERMSQNFDRSQQPAVPHYSEVKKIPKGSIESPSTLDSVSNHSGGSDVTVKIADIEYDVVENL